MMLVAVKPTRSSLAHYPGIRAMSSPKPSNAVDPIDESGDLGEESDDYDEDFEVRRKVPLDSVS